ncbi:glutaredoxin 3 [Sphingomonas sp.]|uniref:glutaredoxin 3 n=1 Tax=Sphingomonas sp. TaxID=28214 RepID=UPI00325FCC80
MAKVEIYLKTTCSFCARARQLLDGKGVAHEDYIVDMGGPKKAEMVQRAGGRTTVPQIFIDGKHVGGCDELMALDRQGKLDELLAA